MPDGIGGKIAHGARGADGGAGEIADRQAVDLQQAAAKPQRRVDGLRGQPRRADRTGLDLEVEIAVREAVDADVADEQRGEGGQPVDVERAADKLEHGRGLRVLGLPPLRFAAKGRAAEHEFEVAERLPLPGQVDVGAKPGGRQAPDRLVDVLRSPGREARWLADRQAAATRKTRVRPRS